MFLQSCILRNPFMICGMLFAMNFLLSQERAVRVTPKADSFELPLNQWVKIAEVPADLLGREIEPGRGAYLCYVPSKGHFIRYGGYTPTESNALWSFDLQKRQWASLLPDDYSFPPPANRPGAGPWWSMAWDSKRKVVWFNGGTGLASHTHVSLFESVWQYNPESGEFKIASSEKYPSFSSPIVYDSKNDVLVRAPAYDREWASQHNRDNTWVFNIEKNEWERRATKDSPKNVLAGVWVFDPSSGKCVYLWNEGDGSSQTWTYDAATNVWEKLETKDAPKGRVCVASTYDPFNKVILVYGGVGKEGNGYGYLYRGGGVQYHDTWALDVTKKEWKKLEVGMPVMPVLNGQDKKVRFETCQAAGYDEKLGAFVVTSPTIGTWALRYQGEGVKELPAIKVDALPALPAVEAPKEPVYKLPEPNPKLVNLEAGKWIDLGGRFIGGGEIPVTYDELTGFILKYGGCNNGGTTFASGYGNDLTAYDPATERWIALRYVDPCGPGRPANGCTRCYAFDPDTKVTWFAGGTAGNYLCNTLPEGWTNENGIWKYDSLKDLFSLVPIKNKFKSGVSVITSYDPFHKVFIMGPSMYSGGMSAFDPKTATWSDISKSDNKALRTYTYSTFVDSLRRLLVVTEYKDSWGAYTFDLTDGLWHKVNAEGDLPQYMAQGRPMVAYDPDNDAVLLVGGATRENKREPETWVYRIKDNRWEKLPEKTPNIVDHMIFDRRHKVFIGFTGRNPVAFRLPKK